MQSVQNIGPAVCNGGVTTFLALVLLSGSTSHTFLTFFKVSYSSSLELSIFTAMFTSLQVFFLTVMFGMFHGLILLPVILARVGPVLQRDEEHETESNEDATNNDDRNIDTGGLDNIAFHTEVS